MFKNYRTIRILWILTALFALIASFIGVFNIGIYNDLIEDKYIPGTISQDYVALFTAIVLLFWAVRMKKGNVIREIIGVGILGFMFYAYGIYVIEQVYNMLYFLYMVIFSISFFSIIYSLINIRTEIIQGINISNTIRKVSIGFSLVIPLIFVPLWIIMLIPLIQAKDRIENIFSVFILDLCFIMPIFIILAILSAKRNGLALLLLPALFVLGFTLLFPVGFSEVVKLIYGLGVGFDLAPVLMYCGIAFMFLIMSVVYLRNIKFLPKPGELNID